MQPVPPIIVSALGYSIVGRTAHVMSFEPGAVLEDVAEWQAPDYCFTAENDLASEPADRRDDDGFIPRIRMPLEG
ncbi:hypothetical protein TRIUR3_00750 [Triticum urartu]|uniref:Uncharacterized protein n=1 Tax=Triticum urartu TaxID=4572 RepID=M7Z1P8_TRIUA|nr:hypothetical protein TRIUR3_00750 [Triticum urartu]